MKEKAEKRVECSRRNIERNILNSFFLKSFGLQRKSSAKCSQAAKATAKVAERAVGVQLRLKGVVGAQSCELMKRQPDESNAM